MSSSSTATTSSEEKGVVEVVLLEELHVVAFGTGEAAAVHKIILVCTIFPFTVYFLFLVLLSLLPIPKNIYI